MDIKICKKNNVCILFFILLLISSISSYYNYNIFNKRIDMYDGIYNNFILYIVTKK